MTIDIKHVSESVYIAYILGLANKIVDLVESVETMKATDLYNIYNSRDRDSSNI